MNRKNQPIIGNNAPSSQELGPHQNRCSSPSNSSNQTFISDRKNKKPLIKRGATDNHQQQQNSARMNRLLELEGECKVKIWQFLEMNQIKAVFVIIVCILSVIGLFVLRYSPKFRKMAFFRTTTSKSEATHIYITGNDKQNDIVQIIQQKSSSICFMYKKLKYEISQTYDNSAIPVAYQFEKQFEQCFSDDRLKKGLKSDEVLKRRALYGSNQHLVQTPYYPSYLLDVMTQPFFLLQYFFCVMYFIMNYAPFSIALLVFSLITTTINYIMLWVSYKKIKEIAQKKIQVKVIRDETQVTINCSQLVPGDIFIPNSGQEVPADCIIGQGDVYVNEANLTGESFPIGKFKISSVGDIQHSNVWIYEGSKILEIKVGKTFAVVINTGFCTHRGRIIRKIMNRTIKDPDIIRTTLIFVMEVVVVSVITFFATLFLMLRLQVDPIFIFFKFIDFLSSSAPPPLPIFFNFAYSLSLFRLGYKDIIGTQPQKTVDGAQIKTFCFDKTGTLTRNDVSISKIFKIKNEENINFQNIIKELGQEKNHLIWKLFATCHTTKLINDQLLGDEIDKQMFAFINAEIINSDDINIRFIVKSTKEFKKTGEVQLGKQQQDLLKLSNKRSSLIEMQQQHQLEVLRINQFQSRFQSMSVLVRDRAKNKYFVFAKGSPQKILSHCCNIAKNSKNSEVYMSMIKTLSLNGLRTIAMGYKQLANEKQVKQYLQIDRQQYLGGITNIGLIAFENLLKVDSWLTINRLIQSNIDPKMITGDNIYIAVETARRAGIINMDDKVIFLEGSRNILHIDEEEKEQKDKGHFQRTFQGTLIEKVSQAIDEKSTVNFQEEVVQIHEKMDYLKGSHIFAVDNAFLTMQPPPLLSHNIKVFARIPPQKKAFVIRQYKKQHNQYIRTHYSRFTRWLKIKTWKIGMCGDGANDLLALREADLSIGVQSTDASYGSSFTVKNMIDVDWVIKQSKNTQENIIVLYQFYGSVSLFGLICTIILITDSTYFSTQQLMYLNFGTVLLLTGTIAMTRPSGVETQFVPDANMMGIHCHLIFWGNLLIPFAGILGAWFYYYRTPDFKPNEKVVIRFDNEGFNSKTSSTTLIFLLVILVIASNAFIMYRSRPWREKFFTNYLFTFVVIVNFSLALVFAFTNKQIQNAFDFQPIAIKEMAICIGIMLGSLIVNLIYNVVVGCFTLDHKIIILQKQQAKLASLIVAHGKAKVSSSLIR